VLELDARVEILGVLSHDYEVDVLEASAHSGIRLARSHLCIEIEGLPQADVH
jgi:hypothetical protein